MASGASAGVGAGGSGFGFGGGGFDSEVVETVWSRWFPFARFAPAAGASLRLGALTLAFVGAALTDWGWRGLDGLFGADVFGGEPEFGTFRAGLPWERETWLGALERVGEPARLAATAARGFAGGPGGLWHGLAALAWFGLVWSVFGGAIARMGVTRAARRGSPGMGAAARFAARRAGRSLLALLSPLLGILALGLVGAGVGLLRRIPGEWGDLAASALFGVALAQGFLMALLFAGLALCWPLMVLTVVAEDEDHFEAISRSYNYATQGVLGYLARVATAGALGVFALVGVEAMTRLTEAMAVWSFAWGAGDLGRGGIVVGGVGSPGVEEVSIGERARWAWLALLHGLAWAAPHSYFWTAFAWIYLETRRDVDGVARDDLPEPRTGSDAEAEARFLEGPVAMPAEAGAGATSGSGSEPVTQADEPGVKGDGGGGDFDPDRTQTG